MFPTGGGAPATWERATCQEALLLGKPCLGIAEIPEALRLAFADALSDLGVKGIEHSAHALESGCLVIVGLERGESGWRWLVGFGCTDLGGLGSGEAGGLSGKERHGGRG